MAYITSEEYQTQIYKQSNDHKIKILFNDIELENANILTEKLTVKSRILPNGSKTLSLSNFVSKEATLILHDIDVNEIKDPVSISIGTLVGNEYEYVPIGIFNIQDVPTTDGNKTTLKLRDNSIKFDFTYNALTLIESNGGPVTKKQILNDICSKVGVLVNVDSFEGENDLIDIYDDSITGRTYISYIAEQAGAIATIDREGKLIFVYLNNLTTHEIPVELVESYIKGKKYTIQNIIYESGIIKYEGNPDYEGTDILYLNSANPYITNQEQVDKIYETIKGFSIDSLSTGRIIGNPSIDGYDLISFTHNGETITTLATMDLTFNGVITMKFNTDISIEARKTNVYKNSEATFKKWARTEIDNAKAEIKILSGQVIETSRKVLSIGNLLIDSKLDQPAYELQIRNACQIFPSKNLFPNNTLYPLGRWLKVTYEDNTYNRYKLPVLALRELNGVYDELWIKTGKVSIIKRIGMNEDESLYILDEPITTNYDDINIILKKGINKIELESFPNALFQIQYMIESLYTDSFSTQAETKALIELATDNIMISVEEKTDKDEVISAINLSPEKIKIDSTKLDVDAIAEFTNSKLAESGSTIINGSNITTGNIDANKVNVTNLNAGNITSGTIDASKINVKNLNADNISSGNIQSKNYVENSTGTKINLTDGSIDTKNLKIDNTGKVEITDEDYLSANFVVTSNKGSEYQQQTIINSFGMMNYIGTDKTNNDNNMSISSMFGYPLIEFNKTEGETSYKGYMHSKEISISKNTNGDQTWTDITAEGITTPTLTQTSLEEKKKNFEKFENGLDVIKNVDIYKYHLKEQNDDDKKHIGFIIGDDYNYSEEITSSDNSGADLYSMISVVLQAVKEQQVIIEALQNKIKELGKE